MRWSVGAVLLAVCAALALSGCRGKGQSADGNGGSPPSVARGKLPDYNIIAQAYNGRVAPFEKIWTTGTVRIWYPDEQGEEQVEQLELHFQAIRPARMLLTLEKVAETVAVLGSNETQYWWIELGKEKKGFVGEHAKANAVRVAELGLPVHPLDLVEVMGITPLPTTWSASSPGDSPQMRWSDDGKQLLVTVLSARNGPRRLWLDPVTFQPSRIELLGRAGKPVVWADLSDFVRVEARPDPNGPVLNGSLPTRLMISIDRQNTELKGNVRVRMTLGNVEASGKRPKPTLFDFDFLRRTYRIPDETVTSLDQ